jgi:hypothetical protein
MFEPKTAAESTDVAMETNGSTQRGGLGLDFGFPGDAKQTKDRSKTKLWKHYFIGNYWIEQVGMNFWTLLLTILYAHVDTRKRSKLDNDPHPQLWQTCPCWSSKLTPGRNMGNVLWGGVLAVC